MASEAIRKSISCALAGLLIVVPALAFLIWLFGHWQPGSRLVEGLIFCFTVGVIWLGTEIFQKKKPKEDE